MDKNVWDIAIRQIKETKDESNDESAIVFIGSKNSGKTSLVLRFLDRDDTTKPTVALEYTFGRRAKGHNVAKDVGHIWELGGGTWLSRLIDVPLTADTILHTSLILFLDLSVPNELWYTLETLLKAAKSRIETIITEKKLTEANFREIMMKRAWERVGTDNPDKSVIDPFLIPLIIIGGKYDIFQDLDPEKRKVICKTLRFVAHSHGATLCSFSVKHEQLVTKTRAILSKHLFGTTLSKSIQADNNKPLFIPAGLDSMQQIGGPPVAEGDIGRVSARTPFELWKHAFTSHFPQQNQNTTAIVDDPSKDPQYAETTIDSLRQQKDQELERYRRVCERKTRDASNFEYVY